MSFLLAIYSHLFLCLLTFPRYSSPFISLVHFFSNSSILFLRRSVVLRHTIRVERFSSTSSSFSAVAILFAIRQMPGVYRIYIITSGYNTLETTQEIGQPDGR